MVFMLSGCLWPGHYEWHAFRFENGYRIDGLCHVDVGAGVGGEPGWHDRIKNIAEVALRRDLIAKGVNVDRVIVKSAEPSGGTTVFFISAIAGDRSFIEKWKDIDLYDRQNLIRNSGVVLKGEVNVPKISRSDTKPNSERSVSH